MNERIPPRRVLALRLIQQDIRSPATLRELHEIDPRTRLTETDGELDWTSKRTGLWVSANAERGKIDTVSMHAEGVDGFAAFVGPLPFGVEFEWSRMRLTTNFGPPDKSGEDHDNWQLGENQLIVEYDRQTGAIAHVTVAS